MNATAAADAGILRQTYYHNQVTGESVWERPATYCPEAQHRAAAIAAYPAAASAGGGGGGSQKGPGEQLCGVNTVGE